MKRFFTFKLIVNLILLLFFKSFNINAQSPTKFSSGDYASPNNWAQGSAASMLTVAGTNIHTTTANAVGNKYFRFYSTTGTTYEPNGSSDIQLTTNTSTALQVTGSGKAYYLNIASTSDNVVFKTTGSGSPGTSKVAAFIIQGAIKTISTVTASSAFIGASVTISATTNDAAAFNTGQGAYLRYSTASNFSTSSVVAMTGGTGGVYTANIPAGTNTANTTVYYYIFTSGNSGPAADGSDADLFTINLNNNGSNFNYTVTGYGATTDGNWTTPSTWANGAVPSVTNPNIIIAANVTLDAAKSVGNVTINSGKTLDCTSNTLTLSGGSTLTNNGTFTAGTGKVVFGGAGTVAGSSTTTFNDVDLSGGVNFGSTSQLNGILSIKAGGYVNTNRPTYNAGSTLKYDQNTTYTILTTDAAWTTGTSNNPKNVEIASGMTLSFGAITENRTASGNITNNGTFNLSTALGGDLVITGNFTNNGTLDCKTRQITFNGTSQTITGSFTGTSNNVIDFLEVANGTNLTLASPVKVTTRILFTNGKITLGSNDLTLSQSVDNASTGISTNSAPSTTSHIIAAGGGKLVRPVTSTAVLFPVGPDAATYSPVTITNTGTSDNFSVNIGTTLSTPIIATKAVGLQWNISEGTDGGSNATLMFQWPLSKEGGSFVRGTGLNIGHYNGATWDLTVAALAGSDPYTATASGFSSFSPFAVMNDVALSVELKSFEAVSKGRNNQLTWATSSEKDNSQFNIQRSTNNQTWQTIGSVKATNNPSGAKYNFTDDAPLSSINYYRLQMVSTDGKIDYSKVVSVSGKDGKQALSVYPNPVKAELNVLTDGTTEGISIYDMTGRMVRQYNDNRSKVNVQDLPNGIYFVRLLDKNGLIGEAVRFVKQ